MTMTMMMSAACGNSMTKLSVAPVASSTLVCATPAEYDAEARCDGRDNGFADDLCAGEEDQRRAEFCNAWMDLQDCEDWATM